MNFIKTDSIEKINSLRVELYSTFTSALDSMWESLYIANSQPYLIQNEDVVLGYCCIDENQSLLQLYLKKAYKHLARATVLAMVEQNLITNAKLSAIEPVSFNACLAVSTTNNEDTICYEFSGHKENEVEISLVNAQAKDEETIKEFYKTQVGFEDTFGYTQNLINRQELYIVKRGDVFVGTGECRLSDSQPNVADVGVAVHTAHRRKGYAAQILQILAGKAQLAAREPICSTTVDNVGSQKAIVNAGFYPSHIIFNIQFKNDIR